jgi:DNA-binding PadR family transcriptional regulator
MAEAKLGELELLVLLAIMRLPDGEAYPVSVVNEIAEHTGRRVRRATVYVLLQRLEAKGLVSTRLGDPLPERGGRSRRLVRLERAGLEAVRDVRTGLLSMWDGLEARFGDA